MESPRQNDEALTLRNHIIERTDLWLKRFDESKNVNCKVIAVALQAIAEFQASLEGQLNILKPSHLWLVLDSLSSPELSNEELTKAAQEIKKMAEMLTKPPEMEFTPQIVHYPPHGTPGGRGYPPPPKFLFDKIDKDMCKTNYPTISIKELEIEKSSLYRPGFEQQLKIITPEVYAFKSQEEFENFKLRARQIVIPRMMTIQNFLTGIDNSDEPLESIRNLFNEEENIEDASVLRRFFRWFSKS